MIPGATFRSERRKARLLFRVNYDLAEVRALPAQMEAEGGLTGKDSQSETGGGNVQVFRLWVAGTLSAEAEADIAAGNLPTLESNGV